MTKHTPEPLRLTTKEPDENYISQGDKVVISADSHEQAHRLVVCWNACAGIPTEALEKGAIAALVKAAQVLSDAAADEAPDIEDYDDTESASSRGVEVGYYEAAELVRPALSQLHSAFSPLNVRAGYCRCSSCHNLFGPTKSNTVGSKETARSLGVELGAVVCDDCLANS